MTGESLRSRTIERWGECNPGLDTSPMELVAQVKRIAGLLELSVAPIYEAAGVSMADVELLVPLRHANETVTAIRLAEMLGMSRAGVSKTLARLESRELITRAPNPGNRRSALITITDRGRTLTDTLFPLELKTHGEVLAGLGQDRTMVMSALEKLAVSMERRLGAMPSRNTRLQ